jgi:hypothetical protein
MVCIWCASLQEDLFLAVDMLGKIPPWHHLKPHSLADVQGLVPFCSSDLSTGEMPSKAVDIDSMFVN